MWLSLKNQLGGNLEGLTLLPGVGSLTIKGPRPSSVICEAAIVTLTRELEMAKTVIVYTQPT